MNLAQALAKAFAEDEGPMDLSNYVEEFPGYLKLDGEWDMQAVVERAIELMEVD